MALDIIDTFTVNPAQPFIDFGEAVNDGDPVKALKAYLEGYATVLSIGLGADSKGRGSSGKGASHKSQQKIRIPDTGTPNVEVGAKVSQKQLRHIAGRKEYRGGGVLNSVDDAQQVLSAYRAGNTTILGQSKQGFPVVRYEGVTGTNINASAGITDQVTNVFLIKGTKSPSVVPMNPNWKP